MLGKMNLWIFIVLSVKAFGSGGEASLGEK